MSTVHQPKQEEYENDDNIEGMIQHHLDWSDMQRRILTANGKMEEYYSTQNGYSFANNELPHYYIQNKINENDNNEHSNTIFDIFHQWKIEEQEGDEQKKYESNYRSPIFGLWKRTLFYSTNTYDYTTNDIEYTFNIQTNTLFIDLRIPKSRDQLFSLLQQQQQQQQHETKQIQSLNDMDGSQLRLYARQHIFAGYTRIVPTQHNKNDPHKSSSIPKSSSITFPYCATRFHCIDWNYIGTSRSRPNKWYIEFPTTRSSHTNSIATNTNDEHLTSNTIIPTTTNSTTTSNIQQWKEWAYATNEYKQHYYCEYWERYSSTHMTKTTTSKVNNDEIYLILRVQSSDNDTTIKQKYGIIIIYNDQLMYCIDRCSDIYPFQNNISSNNNKNNITSLVALIDDLILQQNDLETARSWLSIQGGHGQWINDLSSPNQVVSSSNHNPNNNVNNNNGAWILDHCIEFWLQGQCLFNNTLHTNNHDSNTTITGTSVDDCKIIWKNHIWTIFDTNLQSIDTVRTLILYGP